MIGSVCVHGSCIYIPSKKGTSQLNVVVYKYKQSKSSDECCSFTKRFIEYPSGKNHEPSSILGIASVGVFSTGLNKVFVLLRCGIDVLYVLSCPVSESDKFLKKKVKLKISSKTEICATKLAITDGPTVIYMQEQTAFFLFPLKCDVVTSGLGKLLGRKHRVEKILHFSFIKTSGNTVVYVLVLALTDAVSKVQCVRVFTFQYNTLKHMFADDINEIQIDVFFPSYYQTVISSMFSSFLPSVLNTFNCLKNNKQNLFNWQQNYTIICTQAKQCLLFHKGNMKCFCSILDDSISSIEVLYSWMPPIKWEILLCSFSEGVFWLNLKTEGKLKCVDTWNGASTAVMGDFCQTGSKQILLLFENSENVDPDNIMLVQILPSFSIVVPKPTVEECKYSKNASRKLKGNVKEANILIMETRQSMMQMSAHTKHLVENLVNQNCDDHGEIQNNWLNDIITHEEPEIENQEITISKEVPEKALKLVDAWKKVQEDFLILGWTLKNISENCVQKINGFILADEGWLKSSYHIAVFIHDDLNFGLLPCERKHLTPGETVSVVFSCPVPVLCENQYNISSIISWNIGVSKGILDQIILQNNEFPHQQISISSSFSSDDLVQKEKLCLSDLQDLLSFRATQEVILFNMASKNYDMSSFKEILSQQKPPYGTSVKEYKHMKWALFIDNCCIFHGISITWIDNSSDSLEAYVYFRTESEAVLFVRWLYSILPCDVTILPVKFSTVKQKELRKELLIAMKEEADLLQASLSHQNVMKIDEKEETTSTSKDTYLSASRYCQMKEALIQQELITDNLLCKAIVNL